MTETTEVNIGAVLQAKREQLGFSLGDVAQRTRIRKNYLESIEANRFEDLPGQTYVNGFVRVYADCLGLDDDTLLTQLAAMQSNIAPAGPKPPADSEFRNRKMPSPAKRSSRGWLVAVVLILLFLAGLAYVIASGMLSRVPDDLPVDKAAAGHESRQILPAQEMTNTATMNEPQLDSSLEVPLDQQESR